MLKRTNFLIGLVVLVSLTGCGNKVDRAGTKAEILKAVKANNVSPEDQKCAADAIDKYSDKDLLAIDKDFKAAASGDPTTELGKRFLGDEVNCMRGTMATGMIDEIKKSKLTISADQATCVRQFFKDMSVDRLVEVNKDDAKANAMGTELGTTCLNG